MIYRIILKVGYYERWFDFYDLLEAGNFAETVLKHSVVNEDYKEHSTYISIKVMSEEEAYKIEEEEN